MNIILDNPSAEYPVEGFKFIDEVDNAFTLSVGGRFYPFTIDEGNSKLLIGGQVVGEISRMGDTHLLLRLDYEAIEASY